MQLIIQKKFHIFIYINIFFYTKSHNWTHMLGQQKKIKNKNRASKGNGRTKQFSTAFIFIVVSVPAANVDQEVSSSPSTVCQERPFKPVNFKSGLAN